MSLSVFSLIYDSMVSFLGVAWLAWLLLFIAGLVVFTTILKVPYEITIIMAGLPFLLMGIYATIQIDSWAMAILLFLIGTVIAISLYKIISR